MNVTCPICGGTNVELLEEILRGSIFFEKYICKDCKQLDKELNVDHYYSIWEVPEK